MTYIRVEADAGNFKYIFPTVANLGDRSFQPPIAFSLVGSDPEQTIIFRFVGKQRDIAIQFAIFNNGTDRSDGTAPLTPFPQGVVTIEDQIKFLEDYIFSSDYDAEFYIYNAKHVPTEKQGVIVDKDIITATGGVSLSIGTINFKLGAT